MMLIYCPSVLLLKTPMVRGLSHKIGEIPIPRGYKIGKRQLFPWAQSALLEENQVVPRKIVFSTKRVFKTPCC